MDTSASGGDDASSQRGGGDPSDSHGNSPSAPPITNAILSQAVLNAISQMDTKLAFDMMLLSEQMNTLCVARALRAVIACMMVHCDLTIICCYCWRVCLVLRSDGENKCLKDENAFLKDALAKQTQEQSEMYHYLNGKLDQHVAVIARLECDAAAAAQAHELAVSEHTAALAAAHASFDAERKYMRERIEQLELELRQLHVFAEQKLTIETQMEALEAALAAQTQAFEAERLELERKSIVEKDRVKNEMLVRMRETKDALLQRTDDQVNTTTKRTMMENGHCIDELAFQSKETEKLLERYHALEDEVKRLRVTTKTLEATEGAMAKKNFYYQRILQKLQHQDDKRALDALIQDEEAQHLLQQGGVRSSGSALTNAAGDSSTKRAATKAKSGSQRSTERPSAHQDSAIGDDETKALRTHVDELETALKHAHAWMSAFQTEKQYIVAQQDEIIQFLCRAIQDAAQALAHGCGDSSVDGASVQAPTAARSVPSDEQTVRLAKETTTMDALAPLLPTVALDELSFNETRFVLLFLLEKMKLYQQRLALLFQSTSGHGNARASKHRDVIAKQLGVELPPIHGASALSSNAAATSSSPMSPLKQHRRMFAHVAATVAAAIDSSESSNQSGAALSKKPAAAALHHSMQQHTVVPTNSLLAMATNQFNFLSTASVPGKSPMKTHASSASCSSSSKRTASSTSPVKIAASYCRKPQTQAPGIASVFSKRAALGTAALAAAGGAIASPSDLAQTHELPTAWSSASIPTLGDVESGLV